MNLENEIVASKFVRNQTEQQLSHLALIGRV